MRWLTIGVPEGLSVNYIDAILENYQPLSSLEYE